MKIIILGANKIGASLAENLEKEDNDITVVDSDSDRLSELKDRLDIGTATGQPSFPDVLANAGAQDADMLIAVTDSDETNLVACQVAFSLFRTPKKKYVAYGQIHMLIPLNCSAQRQFLSMLLLALKK